MCEGWGVHSRVSGSHDGCAYHAHGCAQIRDAAQCSWGWGGAAEIAFGATVAGTVTIQRACQPVGALLVLSKLGEEALTTLLG